MNKLFWVLLCIIAITAFVGIEINDTEVKETTSNTKIIDYKKTKEEICDSIPLIIEKVNDKNISTFKEGFKLIGKEFESKTSMDYTILFYIDKVTDHLSAGDKPDQLKTNMMMDCYSKPLMIAAKAKTIIDGDTFKIQATEKTTAVIRLYGIDAPEYDQTGGLEAKIALVSMISGKLITIETDKQDKYGRLIGKVFVNNKDVSLELLKQGHAWHYKKYDNTEKYSEAEIDARTKGIGLWKDKNLGVIEPWEFRYKSKVPDS